MNFVRLGANLAHLGGPPPAMGGPNRSTVSMLGAALSTTAAGFARRTVQAVAAVLCAAVVGVVCQRIRTVPPFQMLERNPLECDS